MSDKRIPSVRVIWLEAFVEVAKVRSYKEAGEKLDVHPTVIKRYLRNLEGWLSKKLHHRIRGRIDLTNDGDEFFSKAKTIIDILDKSRAFQVDYDEIAKRYGLDKQ